MGKRIRQRVDAVGPSIARTDIEHIADDAA
jgi:hypothetical protein